MARVLLVEDDSRVADSIIRALELRGHDVKWAKTVREGDDLIHEFNFDLGIFDLNLPDGFGTELLPTPFRTCMYSGLPDDAERKVKGLGLSVPCFSKGDPFTLLDWIEEK